MQHFLIDEHPAGWSCIVGTDLSLRPGYLDFRSHSTDELLNNPAPRCYCHGDRYEVAAPLMREDYKCSAKCDPRSIEWVYIIGPRSLTVLKSVRTDRRDQTAYHSFKHELVAMIPWDDAEPDWSGMQGWGDSLEERVLV